MRHSRIRRPAALAALLLIAAVAVATVAAVPAEAAETPPHARSRKAAAGGAETIRSIAEVVALDARTRTITLKRDDGNTLNVVAGPTVKNLQHVHVGDFVVAEYGRAQALSLKKTTPATATNGAAASEPGERSAAAKGKAGKPVAASAHTLTIVADIMAIDDKKGLATLKGSRGNIVDIAVKDRRLLSAVKIGDQVTLEYTEAVAVAVKPARSKR